MSKFSGSFGGVLENARPREKVELGMVEGGFSDVVYCDAGVVVGSGGI